MCKPQGPKHHLHFIQAPGSCTAARILSRVRIADHALLPAANLVTVPLVGQQTFHGSLAVVQVVQGLKERGHSQGLCHTTLSLQHKNIVVCTIPCACELVQRAECQVHLDDPQASLVSMRIDVASTPPPWTAA